MKQCILLDNDQLVHMMWEMEAKKQGIALNCFKAFEELNEYLNGIQDKEIAIYLDSDLGNGIKGEEIASELSERGYTSLYITTGHDANDFADLTFIKGIFDKTPPKF